MHLPGFCSQAASSALTALTAPTTVASASPLPAVGAAGTDKDLQDAAQPTALMLAAHGAEISILRALLSPQHAAALGAATKDAGQAAMLRYVNHRASPPWLRISPSSADGVSGRSELGEAKCTALMLGALCGSVEAVALLLDAGAAVDARTPLRSFGGGALAPMPFGAVSALGSIWRKNQVQITKRVPMGL